jgi:hypothetical protein
MPEKTGQANSNWSEVTGSAVLKLILHNLGGGVLEFAFGDTGVDPVETDSRFKISYSANNTSAVSGVVADLFPGMGTKDRIFVRSMSTGGTDYSIGWE